MSNLQQMFAYGERDGFCAVGHAEFLEEPREVLLDHRERDAEDAGDFRVGAALRDGVEDVLDRFQSRLSSWFSALLPPVVAHE